MSSELMKIAEGFSQIAEGIRELAKEEKCDGTKVKVQNIKNTKRAEKQTKEQEEKINIEEIRAVLADKSQEGKTKEVRELLKQFGVAKLSAVEEKDYPELLQKAKVL